MIERRQVLPWLASCLAGVILGTCTRAEDWPGWRGPRRQGTSTESSLPVRWSAAENVVWKADIPGLGWSSPIVCGERVFVTTAADKGASCRLICLDRRTGKIVWDREVMRQKPGLKHENNSYATPTPLTDGERVYTVFSGGGIAAVSLTGKVLWSNRDHSFHGVHGCGASPILYDDLLIFPFDITSDGADKALGHTKAWDRSYILAVDKKSGKERWKAKRGLSRVAHSTPNILEIDKKSFLVGAAGDVVQAHDPRTGKRLWSVASPGEGVVPSVVSGNGLIFTASGFGAPAIRAIRAGADGKAKIVWQVRKAVPMVASFVFGNGCLFTINENGVAQCLKADTGAVRWQERLGGSYYASPVIADGKIYFLNQQGETAVVAAEPRFKVIARNSLGEKCRASLAVSHKQLFIRSEKHLYCIGRP